MANLLKETVQEVERILQSDPDTTHRWDRIQLLRKWRNEAGLAITQPVQVLIAKLITEFGNDYPEV